MDTTEKILKLAALGWDGKEPELEFFHRVYGIKAEIIPGNEMTEVILTYKGTGKTCQTRVKVKKKKVDPVRHCLRLFRTNNGEPEGPNVKYFISEDQEWT